MDEQLRSVFRNNFNNNEYYEEVICSYNWELNDLRNYITVINVEKFVKVCTNLSNEIIFFLLNESYITIDTLIKYQQLPEIIIKSIFDNDEGFINDCLQYQQIDIEILRKNVLKLDWWLVSENQYLDLQFLVENLSKIQWDRLPFNHNMSPYINEGMISLFQQTNIWDNIGYTDIELEILTKYKQFFTEKTYDSLLECRGLTRECID